MSTTKDTIDTRELVSFSLTHFQYKDGDKLGMFLALMSLAPIFLIVLEVTVILSRREIAGIRLLIGQLINEAFNLVLKEWIKEDRPHVELGDGYGMPSSHSQFMGFFAIYSIIYLEKRVSTNIIHKRIVQYGTAALGVLVSTSRVYLHYHTIPQVLTGVLVGMCSGLLWYVSTEYILYRRGIASAISGNNICKWLMVRDSSRIIDIAHTEYLLCQSDNDFKQK